MFLKRGYSSSVKCPKNLKYKVWTNYCNNPQNEKISLGRNELQNINFFFFFRNFLPRCTCVPHPETPSNLPPHPILLGCPSTPAVNALFHASNFDWPSISHMVIYMFQYYFLKSSHPHLLPQSPKVCSLYLCLFCCLAYKVIITIFLNSMYML